MYVKSIVLSKVYPFTFRFFTGDNIGFYSISDTRGENEEFSGCARWVAV